MSEGNAALILESAAPAEATFIKLTTHLFRALLTLRPLAKNLLLFALMRLFCRPARLLVGVLGALSLLVLGSGNQSADAQLILSPDIRAAPVYKAGITCENGFWAGLRCGKLTVPNVPELPNVVRSRMALLSGRANGVLASSAFRILETTAILTLFVSCRLRVHPVAAKNKRNGPRRRLYPEKLA